MLCGIACNSTHDNQKTYPKYVSNITVSCVLHIQEIHIFILKYLTVKDNKYYV